jgi:chorismate--pyruvate lyase
LTDTTSLTRKLMERSRHFHITLLRQARRVCLADEYATVGLPRCLCVTEREVVLECDGRPTVYGHSIVPLNATASDWPFFGTLGERSLGSTLFGDPRVMRGAMEYARLHPHHPLMRRAAAALGDGIGGQLYARRCLYRRKKGMLLVTEIFLPAIADIPHQRIHKQSIE